MRCRNLNFLIFHFNSLFHFVEIIYSSLDVLLPHMCLKRSWYLYQTLMWAKYFPRILCMQIPLPVSDTYVSETGTYVSDTYVQTLYVSEICSEHFSVCNYQHLIQTLMCLKYFRHFLFLKIPLPVSDTYVSEWALMFQTLMCLKYFRNIFRFETTST